MTVMLTVRNGNHFIFVYKLIFRVYKHPTNKSLKKFVYAVQTASLRAAGDIYASVLNKNINALVTESASAVGSDHDFVIRLGIYRYGEFDSAGKLYVLLKLICGIRIVFACVLGDGYFKIGYFRLTDPDTLDLCTGIAEQISADNYVSEIVHINGVFTPVSVKIRR